MRPEDATDRWAAWSESAYVRESLNMDSRPRTKAEMQAYIAGFDQQNRLILGVFTKSHKDGSMIDLCLYKLTREARADWRQAHPFCAGDVSPQRLLKRRRLATR